MLTKMTEIETQLTAIRTEVARLSAGRDPDVPLRP